ncbi:hypothetical protein [Erwinia pyrifoliae]|uniref:Uncharacterized protein n=1 Tax=Erwinia pyrifoliae TaxID=79967 RepID=A0ABY5X980_ERWPY|nr:hypothetical protein [Erwinia pyrifoliae]MCA8875587.1 hypothetical protein [Erwinia pyrifoliae]MCT2385793.1 hypothetical protein [Erwinia pyrifoliae]MCU8588631.1 hypothetical protein [Erwinia pyrifoliae]UWS29629.1 hypothetical protein NYP81_17515 [Erwinia pyrifoliae]UWS33946.1 hypothetical protein NYP84_01675 [Erwinia pyrifoliae]
MLNIVTGQPGGYLSSVNNIKVARNDRFIAGNKFSAGYGFDFGQRKGVLTSFIVVLRRAGAMNNRAVRD